MNKCTAFLVFLTLAAQKALATEVCMPEIAFYSPQDVLKSQYKYELAITEAEQRKGLMYRRFLAEDQGMLFKWDNSEIRTMWMKHTYIPLDMIYIRHERVVGIIEHAQPHSEDILGADIPPSEQILEVKGSEVSKRQIQIGDKVKYINNCQ